MMYICNYSLQTPNGINWVLPDYSTKGNNNFFILIGIQGLNLTFSILNKKSQHDDKVVS